MDGMNFLYIRSMSNLWLHSPTILKQTKRLYTNKHTQQTHGEKLLAGWNRAGPSFGDGAKARDEAFA